MVRISYGLICGEWWEFSIIYCVLSVGNSLRVIVCLVVGICYGLFCGDWWQYVMSYFADSVGSVLWVIVW
jgi:hypothetical protein